VVLRPAPVLGDPVGLLLELGRELLGSVDLLLGEEPGLDALGQLDLLLGVEQRDLADLLQVVLDRVRSGTGGRDLLGRSVLLVLVGQCEGLSLLPSGSSVGSSS
jgi:hypothetical protein